MSGLILNYKGRFARCIKALMCGLKSKSAEANKARIQTAGSVRRAARGPRDVKDRRCCEAEQGDVGPRCLQCAIKYVCAIGRCKRRMK